MKKKHNEGFSLVETLVSIAVLALIVIPTCSGIVMGFRMNAKSDELMKAQLAVSSAVETLMAEGIPDSCSPDGNEEEYAADRFDDVTVKVSKENSEDAYYTVVVESDLDSDVMVTTNIRAVTPEGGTGE